MKYTKKYNLKSIKQIDEMERLMSKLYNMYDHVRVIVLANNEAKIEYC